MSKKSQPRAAFAAPSANGHPRPPYAAENLWTVPNALTVGRLPLAAVLFLLIALGEWYGALAVFLVASASDWLDGWWARRFNCGTAFGRAFDPLIDKVLTNGAFIFLIPVAAADMHPWMVAVVVGRELLVTGVRGYLESVGKKFGADWFGKLKMFLQCVYLGVAFFYLANAGAEWVGPVRTAYYGLLYAMLAATVLSGVQYGWKAYALLRG